MAVVVYRLALIESDTSNMGSIPFPKPKFICCQYLYSMHSTCVKLKKSRVVCVCWSVRMKWQWLYIGLLLLSQIPATWVRFPSLNQNSFAVNIFILCTVLVLN